MAEPLHWTAELEEINRALARIQASAAAAVAQVNWEGLSRSFRALPKQAAELGANGWTLPMWLTPVELEEILAAARTRDIDEVFVDYYESDGGGPLAALHSSIRRQRSLEPWRPLVEECLAAFDDDLYRVIVPSVLTVIEGALIALAKAPRAKDPKQPVKAALHSTRDGSVVRAAWISIDGFVSGLYKSHPFGRGAPDTLNRHWIMHGRAGSEWGRVDALRLFQAVDTIASVIGGRVGRESEERTSESPNGE